MSANFVPKFEPRWRAKASPPAGSPNIVVKDTHPETDVIAAQYNYPQFLGPNRNAAVTTLKLERDWRKHPPELLWKQPIGEGWSAFSVIGSRAITQERHGENEAVVCYDLMTGAVLWTHHNQARFESGAYLGGVGPRATPTIHDGKVYTLGATGLLNCLSLATGECCWQKDILADNGAQLPQWGYAGSPLIIGSLVVVHPGGFDSGSLVAYHRETGERVWGAGDDPAGYSSPLLATIAGQRQVVIFTADGIVGHDIVHGNVLWEFPWPKETIKIAQPVC